MTIATAVALAPAAASAAIVGIASDRDTESATGLAFPAEDQSSAPDLTTPEAGTPTVVKVQPEPKGPFQFCPVDRPRHYVDDFGDARYFGGFHRHQGIDVFAPKGTPIRAPFDGMAKHSTSWAGGLQVYLYGKQGFAFNAHLTRTGKMGKVKAGTVIGYVGNSGDARGSSPHDHFEWHPGGGKAVDPFKLLNAACSKRPQAAVVVTQLAAETPSQIFHSM